MPCAAWTRPYAVWARRGQALAAPWGWSGCWLARAARACRAARIARAAMYRPQHQGRDETHDQPRGVVAEQPGHRVDALRLDEAPGAAADRGQPVAEAVRVEPALEGVPAGAEGRRDDLGRQPHHEHADRAPQRRTELTGRRHRERQRQRHRQDRAVGPGGRGQARHQGQDDRQRRRSSAAARAEHEPEQAADREQHGQHHALTGYPVDAGRPQEPAEPAHRRDHEEAQAGRADQGRDGRSRCRRAEEHQVAVAGPKWQEEPVVEPGEPGRPPEQQGKERGTDPPGARRPAAPASRLHNGSGRCGGLDLERGPELGPGRRGRLGHGAQGSASGRRHAACAHGESMGCARCRWSRAVLPLVASCDPPSATSRVPLEGFAPTLLAVGVPRLPGGGRPLRPQEETRVRGDPVDRAARSPLVRAQRGARGRRERQGGAVCRR